MEREGQDIQATLLELPIELDGIENVEELRDSIGSEARVRLGGWDLEVVVLHLVPDLDAVHVHGRRHGHDTSRLAS